MDTVSKEVRSRIMSRIRSKGTSIEVAVLGMLDKRGLVHHVFGADFVYMRRKVAVRVHGCFFHACPAHGTVPKSNAGFWRKKFRANIARDARVKRLLRRRGYKVVDIWEHDVRKRPHVVLAKLKRSGL